MKVISLNSTELAEHSRRLADMVNETSYRPEVIIGIHTGGYETARLMMPHMDGAMLTGYSVSRASSRQRKRGVVQRILRHLPMWMLDHLRIIESKLRQLNSNPVRVAATTTDSPIPAATQRILVVDDAIDSGASMIHAIKMLQEQCPRAEVRTAVLTVTTPSPMVSPDYVIYNNQTLLRFPWSMDALKQ